MRDVCCWIISVYIIFSVSVAFAAGDNNKPETPQAAAVNAKVPTPQIDSVDKITIPTGKTDIVARKDEPINIKVKNFDPGKKAEETWILFGDKSDIQCKLKHDEKDLTWNESTITPTVPKNLLRIDVTDFKDAYFRICYKEKPTVVNGEPTVEAIPANDKPAAYIDQVQSIVDYAITRFKQILPRDKPDAKSSADAETTLANELYNKQLQDLKGDLKNDPHAVNKVFGGVTLNINDLKALTDAGLSTDFIEKMEGQKRWLSLGATVAFMFDTTEVTPAGALRIFLQPKGYYSPRTSFTSSLTRIWDIRDQSGYGFCNVISTGYHLIRENFDLLVGYTAATHTAKGGDESKAYVLTGLTFEFNRFIFIDAGWAFVPGGSDKGKDGQLFVGLGIDPSILDWGKFLGMFGFNAQK